MPWTPLHHASERGDATEAAQLIKDGADLEAGYNGITPLHTAANCGNIWRQNAAASGHAECVKVLLQAGANKEAKDHRKLQHDNTPLHYAAIIEGNVECVQLLVEAGANKEATNQDGKTPLDLARERGYSCVVELLTAPQAPMTQLPVTSAPASVDTPTINPLSGPASIRLTDIPVDDGALSPITGVMESPLVDLMTAAEQTGVADMDSHSFMAVEKAEALQADGQLRGLSVDEAAAIALYTAECEFYRTLNVLLRNRSREALKPFFPYLRLLLQARSKLPKHTQSVWRGVKGVDLTGSFPKGKKIFWWAFNSTSKNVSTLLDPMFCGTSGTRTQFMIEAVSGIDIAHYSMVDSEAEVLLFPGTKLEVVDVADMGHGLFQVHLREVKLPVQLIK